MSYFPLKHEVVSDYEIVGWRNILDGTDDEEFAEDCCFAPEVVSEGSWDGSAASVILCVDLIGGKVLPYLYERSTNT